MIGASALVALPVGDSKGGKRKAKDGISIGSSTNTSGYLVARYFLAAKDPREVRPNTGELDLFNNSIQVRTLQRCDSNLSRPGLKLGSHARRHGGGTFSCDNPSVLTTYCEHEEA